MTASVVVEKVLFHLPPAPEAQSIIGTSYFSVNKAFTRPTLCIFPLRPTSCATTSPAILPFGILADGIVRRPLLYGRDLLQPLHQMLVVDHVLRLRLRGRRRRRRVGPGRVVRMRLPVPAQDAAAAASTCPFDEWLLQLLVVMEAAACARRHVDISQLWLANSPN